MKCGPEFKHSLQILLTSIPSLRELRGDKFRDGFVRVHQQNCKELFGEAKNKYTDFFFYDIATTAHLPLAICFLPGGVILLVVPFPRIELRPIEGGTYSTALPRKHSGIVQAGFCALWECFPFKQTECRRWRRFSGGLKTAALIERDWDGECLGIHEFNMFASWTQLGCFYFADFSNSRDLSEGRIPPLTQFLLV